MKHSSSHKSNAGVNAKASRKDSKATDFTEEARDIVRYLASAINSIEDELLIIGLDFRVIEANKAVLSKHRKSKKDILGRYCYEVSHDTSEFCCPPYHECPIKTLLETGEPARTTHVHVYDVNHRKQERYLDIIASPLRDRRGHITAIVEMMRDVTDTKKLEIEITKAHQNLLALNSITSVISQSLDLDIVLNNALDKILEIMQKSMGCILLLDDERQSFYYQVHRGLSIMQNDEICLRIGEGIAGEVIRTGQAIAIDDILKYPHTSDLDFLTAEGIRSFISVPLSLKQNALGVLNLAGREAYTFGLDDIRLLESIATHIAIAIENAKLHQQARHKEEIRGELLQDTISVQEEERRRIARELHDETSQALASLAANLEAAIGTLPVDANKVHTLLKKSQALSINILDEIHNVIYKLRPTLLDDLGLVAAIRWLLDNNLGTNGVKTSFKTTGSVKRFPAQLETTLFRVIQEAVNNIDRHAQANNVDVRLHFSKGAVEANLKDDGQGFNLNEAMHSKDRPRGLGLLGMKERVELVNGTLNISTQPGSGTEISIEIPLV